MNFFFMNFQNDRPIINLLGEICWGFEVDGFERKIGVKKKVVEALLERLLKEEKAGAIEIYLSDSEVSIVKRALNEVEKEIEEWEFQMRIGISRKEVIKILERINRK